MKKYVCIILALVLLGLSGCQVWDGISGDDEPENLQIPQEGKVWARSAEPELRADDAYNRTPDLITDCDRMVYSALTDSSKNTLVSPYSYKAAFMLLYQLLKGEEKQEMADFLGFGDLSEEDINATWAWHVRQLTEERAEVILETANAAWISEYIQVNEDAFEEVTQILESYYGCKIEMIDFANAMDIINSWANEKTHGMIPELLTTEMAKQVPWDYFFLANAVYFNGGWQKIFSERNTVKEEFFGNSETVVTDMMYLYDDEFGYAEVGDYRTLTLNYGPSGQVVMDVIISADETHGVDPEVLFGGDGKVLEQVLETLKSSDQAEFRYIALPKWTTEAISTVEGMDNQAEVIEKMLGDGLDLSHIFPNLPKGPLGVFQKAKIIVNEKGTEAAAVTAVTTAASAPETGEPSTLEFRADHPFAYLIRDRKTGEVLFAGMINQL